MDLTVTSNNQVQPTGTTTHPIDASKYSNFKMVLVIRKDVEMTKGKVAAQCCHACLAAYNECMSINPAMAKRWERIGQAKITLRCNSEEEMLELQAIARSLSLPAQSIRDAGHTQIAAGTRTVLAIGPAPAEMVDQVTKHLKLY
ncbi:peptidyl-tRNA hydrolase [Blastocladiella britannica]|nr:peptidyl-tRNA hydrolase [Blastocladiella britannica]